MGRSAYEQGSWSENSLVWKRDADLGEKEFKLLLSAGVPGDVTARRNRTGVVVVFCTPLCSCYCPVCSSSSRVEVARHRGASSHCSLPPKCSLSCLGELLSYVLRPCRCLLHLGWLSKETCKCSPAWLAGGAATIVQVTMGAIVPEMC